ncbi:hypothetical protein NM688_g882 [Phlebia brevispora]|uniref:Uncharacterized protein n=1 Tax=Phlebia brevispora TaxID=194682 RepID=A0ACC1TD38_9APHY|nr:hypothetical protein NM688_g882 [Phlebia brevispora]
MDTTQHIDGQARFKYFSHTLLARFNGRNDYVTGLFLLLIVVFLWTSSNFVTQDLFDGGYEKPFLRSVKALQTNEEGRPGYRPDYEPLPTDVPTAEASSAHDFTTVSHHHAHYESGNGTAPLTIKETARLAAWFCLLWFVANWTVNAALGYTSVASATILSSMSGFFTLGIGRLFRVEALTLVKIAAVVASFGGVVLVSLSDSQLAQDDSPVTGLSTPDTHNSFGPAPIIGDSLALLSALFYATYVILLKVRVREESRIDMQLFFGFVGLFNILFCWPIGLALHLARVERFELPTSSRVVVGILINMAITLSSDYIYVLAMLKTTPLVVTVGLSLTMPLAVIGDFLLHKPVTFKVILGAVIVIFSFVAVGLDDARNEEENDLIAGRPLDVEATVNAPKDNRKRNTLHEHPVAVTKRQFAVQNNAVKHIEIGQQEHVSSHERRLKRKAREQVAGGLQDMAAAISTVESDIPAAVQNSVPARDDPTEEKDRQIPRKRGLIGEGKGAPLTKFQRKRALQTERLRMPRILSNTEFASNPFQTIRTHAQNTLVKHST